MPASFAGVDLLLGDPDGAFQSWLDRHLPLADASLFCEEPVGVVSRRWDTRRNQGAAGGVSWPNWANCPRWKINSLWWPTGASRWSVGLFLTDSTGLASILSSVGSGGSGQLKLSDGRSVAINATMHLLPPRQLTGTESGNRAYLLPLVDERYLWRWKPTTTSFTFTESSTWANVFTALGTALGVSVSHDTVHADYVRPDPVELSRRAENAAILLDAVAESVGQRVVRRLNGTVESRNWSTAGSTLDANEGRSTHVPFAGHVGRDAAAARPSEVKVVFAKSKGSVPYVDGDVHVVTEAASSHTSLATVSATKVLYSTALADFSSEGASPDNASAINSLATRIAADYYAGLARRYDRSFIGLADWTPCGFDDWIWYHLGSQPEHSAGASDYDAYTRVSSHPYNFGASELLHQFSQKQPSPVGLFYARVGAGEFLQPGGNAGGQSLLWNGSSYGLSGQNIEIYDPHNHVSGYAGDEMTCMLDASNRITAVGGIRARFWQYKLKENWGATTPHQATCDLLTLHDGTDTGIDVVVYSRPTGLWDVLRTNDKLLGIEQDGKHYGVQAVC